MSLPICTAPNSASVAASTTFFYALGDGFGGNHTTEANGSMAVRTAQTLSLMRVRVSANNRGTSTGRTRVNTANGGQSVSISGTGEFADASGSDALNSTDKVNYSLVTGSGGSSFISTMWMVITSINAIRYVISSTSGGAQAGGAPNAYTGIAADMGLTTTESTTKQRFVCTVTMSELAAFLSAFSGTTGLLIRSRKNGVNGGQSVTLNGTGHVQDASGTDSLVDTDDYGYQYDGAAGTSYTVTTATSIATASSTLGMFAASTSWNQNVNLTRFNLPYYAGGPTATELDARTEIQVACTASRLGTRLDTNTVTAASTMRLRVNGANGTESVSITASTTGQFEDPSGSDTLVSTDEICYSMVTGATGTSIQARSSRLLLTGGSTTPTAVESLRVAFGEFAAILASVMPTDSPSVKLSESAPIVVSVDPPESTAVVLGDTTTVIAAQAAVDTTVVQASEANALTVLVTPTDAVAVQVSEVLAILVMIAVADLPTLQASDLVAILATLDVADVDGVQVSDLVAILALVAAQDATSVIVSETPVIVVSTAVTDALATGASENASLTVSIATSDGVSTVIRDANALDAFVAVAEALGLSLIETATLFVTLAATENVAVVVSDIGTVFVIGGTDFVGADAAAIVLIERAALDVFVDVAETLTLQTTESATLDAIVTVFDALALRGDDLTTVAVLAATSDAVAVVGAEQSNIAVLVSTTEAAALGLTELVDLLAQLDVSEAVILVLAEDTAGEADVIAAEDVAVATDEGSLLLVTVDAAAEALGLTVSDFARVLATLTAQDDLAIFMTEQAFQDTVTTRSVADPQSADWRRWGLDRDPQVRPTIVRMSKRWWR